MTFRLPAFQKIVCVEHPSLGRVDHLARPNHGFVHVGGEAVHIVPAAADAKSGNFSIAKFSNAEIEAEILRGELGVSDGHGCSGGESLSHPPNTARQERQRATQRCQHEP
jgi:hypothetical protein